jgi:hypothetical protein
MSGRRVCPNSILLATVLFIAVESLAAADQFAWVSRAEAERAAEMLSPGVTIRHFCAPCGDEDWRPETVHSVEMVSTGSDDYHEVLVNGEGIDLAYVYLPVEGEYANLAITLGLEASGVPERLEARRAPLGFLDTYFAGTLGDGLRVLMVMSRHEDRVYGSYAYTHVGQPIEISGTMDDAGNFTLNETADGEKTGVFVGRYDRPAGLLTGQWMTPDASRQLPFRLARFAWLIQEKRMTAITLHGDTAAEGEQEGVWLGVFGESERVMPYLDASLSLPCFVPTEEPLPKRLNALIRRKADSFLAEGSLFFLETASEFANEPAPEVPFSMHAYAECNLNRVYAYAPPVVSLALDHFTYSGGAHGMNWTDGLNVRVDGESVSEITLDDCFRPGADYLPALGPLVLTSLKEQEASWVVNGEVTSLEKDGLGSFALGGNGITFFFAPYAMGSYAEGAYEVTVPWSALGDLPNQELVAQLGGRG